MDKPRHPQVFRSWKVERLKQRVPGGKPVSRKGTKAKPEGKA
jgi:hypothetical protein